MSVVGTGQGQARMDVLDGDLDGGLDVDVTPGSGYGSEFSTLTP